MQTLRLAGVGLMIADARQPVIRMAQRSGLLDQLGDDRIFHTIDAAVQSLGAAPAGPGRARPRT